MSLPKSRLELRVGGVAAQLVVQQLAAEDVDAHARERPARAVRHLRRVRGLLDEGDDAVLGVDVHHAERARVRHGNLDAGDGHVGAGVHVLHQHALVVHLVDVVAGEDHQVLRLVAVDDVDVLEHRVRRARVPLVVAEALAGGQDVEGLVAHRLQEVPAALQVADQAVRLVLRGHRDAPDAGVERVGEREVDDARLAAEIDRRLGAPVGEFHQPRAAAAGEHIGHRGACEGSRVGDLFHGCPFTNPVHEPGS